MIRVSGGDNFSEERNRSLYWCYHPGVESEDIRRGQLSKGIVIPGGYARIQPENAMPPGGPRIVVIVLCYSLQEIESNFPKTNSNKNTVNPHQGSPQMAYRGNGRQV